MTTTTNKGDERLAQLAAAVNEATSILARVVFNIFHHEDLEDHDDLEHVEEAGRIISTALDQIQPAYNILSVAAGGSDEAMYEKIVADANAHSAGLEAARAGKPMDLDAVTSGNESEIFSYAKGYASATARNYINKKA